MSIRRQRFSNENGAAALEFALIVTALLLIVFGIVEFGRIYSQLEVFNSAAREGARVAAVRGTPEEIKGRIEDAADPYQPSFEDYSVSPASCTVETKGDPITVSWNQNFEISVGILPSMDADVQVKGVFRCE